MARVAYRTPGVTALLPACNAAGFIEETLRSLAAQTYGNLRVLISVDACGDDTAELCERFATTDARFTVVRQPRRLGWIGNANFLIQHTDTELCFLMGHDDLVSPTYVATLVDALRSNPRAVLAYSDLEAVWPGGERSTMSYPVPPGIASRRLRAQHVLEASGNWWCTYRGLFAADLAKQGNPLRRHLVGEASADWPFLLFFVLQGEIVRAPEPLYCKRFRPDSLSSTWRAYTASWVALSLNCAHMLVASKLPMPDLVVLLGRLGKTISAKVANAVGALPRRVLGQALQR